MVHADFGKHRIVLDLRFSERRTIVRNQNQFSLGASEALEHGLVAERVLAALHHESELVVDVFLSLLGFLGGRHLRSTLLLLLLGFPCEILLLFCGYHYRYLWPTSYFLENK